MATFITANDLQFEYSRTAIPPDDPRRTGKPDTTFLNRREQYEVLDFINRFCSNTQYGDSGPKFGRAEALIAERLIRMRLPGDVRSHANVVQWLRSNWDSKA